MKRITQPLLVAVGLCLIAQPASAKPEEQTPGGWTMKSALKQVDRATKKLTNVSTDVRYAESTGSRPINGAGKLYLRPDGIARAEIGGNHPRTFLSVPPFLHVYRPQEKLAEVHNLSTNRDMLVQYALVGFFPAGSSMRKDYDVVLAAEEMLDDTATLRFVLAPIGKQISASLARIDLWIDLSTWLPVQQVIVHRAGLELTVRYLSVSTNDELDYKLFLPEWPPGTATIKK